MNTGAIVYLSVFIIGVVLFFCYAKSGKFWRCVLFTLVSGLAALGAVYLAGMVLPVHIAITPLSLFASGVMGIPGVVLMLVFTLL